jgi:hypothetical protein
VDDVFLIPEPRKDAENLIAATLQEKSVCTGAISRYDMQSASLSVLRTAFPYLSFTDVPADGHCYYRVLAHAVYGDQEQFMAVRRDIAAALDVRERPPPADDDEYSEDDINGVCFTNALLPPHVHDTFLLGIKAWAEEREQRNVMQHIVKHKLLSTSKHPSKSVLGAVVNEWWGRLIQQRFLSCFQLARQLLIRRPKQWLDSRGDQWYKSKTWAGDIEISITSFLLNVIRCNIVLSFHLLHSLYIFSATRCVAVRPTRERNMCTVYVASQSRRCRLG